MNRRDVLRPGVIGAAQESEQLGHRCSITWDADLWRDLVEGNEDECALGQAGMRNLKIGFTEVKISQQYNIQVQGAGAIAHAGGAVTAEFALDFEQRIEKAMRGEAGFKRDDRIQKPGLVGEADGRGGIERGAVNDAACRGFEPASRGGQRGGGRSRRTGDICSHRDVGCEHGIERISQADGASMGLSAARRRRQAAVSAARAAYQTTNAVRTAHAGATPTRFKRNGRKFHAVMWT